MAGCDIIPSSLLSLRPLRSVQLHAGTLLQMAEDAEQVVRLRIAAWAEHAHQAFGLGAGFNAKTLEADGRLDLVAQDRLASIHVAGKHRVNAFAQQESVAGIAAPSAEVG